MNEPAQRTLTALALAVESETGAIGTKLPREYTYKSLPLALIDAIFSIGVTYRSTENTVERFCQRQQPPWSRYRWEAGAEHGIAAFLDSVSARPPDGLAREIYGNRQRTSARNGILKADAVTRCARVLISYGIDSFADAWKLQDNAALEHEFRRVPGQGSGISFTYLKMLCGDDDGIKLDRHIQGFMRRLHIASVQQLRDVAAELNVSPRTLDYAIWRTMRRTAA